MEKYIFKISDSKGRILGTFETDSIDDDVNVNKQIKEKFSNAYTKRLVLEKIPERLTARQLETLQWLLENQLSTGLSFFSIENVAKEKHEDFDKILETVHELERFGLVSITNKELNIGRLVQQPQSSEYSIVKITNIWFNDDYDFGYSEGDIVIKALIPTSMNGYYTHFSLKQWHENV